MLIGHSEAGTRRSQHRVHVRSVAHLWLGRREILREEASATRGWEEAQKRSATHVPEDVRCGRDEMPERFACHTIRVRINELAAQVSVRLQQTALTPPAARNMLFASHPVDRRAALDRLTPDPHRVAVATISSRCLCGV